jgi:biopolymer transport protein ExbD
MNATADFVPEKKKARIEIIPLIDVVFFLCATFVLFTLSLERIGGLPVNLPRSGPPHPADTTVFIQASDGGAVYWKYGDHGTSELISRAELPARLAQYRQSVDVPRVFVRGDNKAKFGEAVGVFDEVRRAGIKQVSIETQPSKTGS